MKKAAIYIRVSTTEQSTEGYSIPAQKEKLTAYCKAKGWLIYDIYIDGGFTGTNIDRPALQEMLKHLQDIDIVLVYKLDRLSRSQRDVLYLVEECFLKSNVDFVSTFESFDTSTPFGKAMLGILAVFAQLERETILERTKLGKERRAKEGLWRGGSNVPVGYDFIDGNLVVNEYEAMQVREAFKLFLDGYGTNKISVLLNEKGYKTKYGKWSGPRVRYVLINQTYRGFIEYNGEYHPGIHEAVVDEETWSMTQELQNTKSKSTVKKSKYLLGGLLWCGHCEARLKPMWNMQNHYYVCYSVSKRPVHMVKDPDCAGKYWRMDELDEKVKKSIVSMSLDQSKFIELYNAKKDDTIDSNIPILQNQLTDIEKQINRMMDLYQDGKIPVTVISERIEKLYNEKKSIQNNIAEKEKELERIKSTVPLGQYLHMLDNFESIWEKATFDEQRLILQYFIKKVIVSDDIEIEWNI